MKIVFWSSKRPHFTLKLKRNGLRGSCHAVELPLVSLLLTTTVTLLAKSFISCVLVNVHFSLCFANKSMKCSSSFSLILFLSMYVWIKQQNKKLTSEHMRCQPCPYCHAPSRVYIYIVKRVDGLIHDFGYLHFLLI